MYCNVRKNITAMAYGMAIAALGIFATSLAPEPAHAQSLDEVKSKGELSVGIVTDQIPFGFIDTNGANDGYDIAVAKQLSKDLGVTPRFTQVTSANRIPLLLTGKVDILICVLGIYPDRAKVIQYVTPYAVIDAEVYGPVGDPIKSVDDLVGKTVGVEKGSAMDKKLAETPGIKLLKFDDASAAAQALLSGQVQYLGSFSHTFVGVEKAAPGKFESKIKFFAAYIGMAVRPNSGEFGNWVAQQVSKYRQDGTLNKFSEQYFGKPLQEMPTKMEGISFLTQ